MTSQPGSDRADRDDESARPGVARDLERNAEKREASRVPLVPPADDPESPGATIDSPDPAEPNEPAYGGARCEGLGDFVHGRRCADVRRRGDASVGGRQPTTSDAATPVAEDEQNESNDRENDEDGPKHDG
jgi:hypothetical protein